MNRLEKLKLQSADEFISSNWGKRFEGDVVKFTYYAGFDLASAEYEKIITELEKVLIVSKGAMAYAYEDHSDKFYLNVKEDIEKALQKLKEFIG